MPKHGTIYLIPLFQGDVGAICWGSCGKGQVAGIEDPELGPCIPCFEADCPNEKGSMDLDAGTIGGEKYQHIVVRKVIERKDKP